MEEIHPDFIIDYKTISLGARIGFGTFGEVWKGTWGNIDVAIKKVFIAGANPELVKQLYKELHTLITVRHPSILIYYGVCVAPGGELWIVMELSEVGSLLSMTLNKRQPMSRSERIQWMIDAATVVEYLHSRNIFLRSIKSTNFLAVNNKFKISDFGMVAAVAIHATKLSKEALGPARWLAPENPKDKKADLFALGMIFYELLEQEIPFFGLQSDEIEVEKRIKGGERPKMKNEFQQLKILIGKAWDSAPDNRPALSDMTKILGEFLKSSGGRGQQDRKFFEINLRELRPVVPQDRVTTYKTPPNYPIEGEPVHLPLPEQVEIFRLLSVPADKKQHPIVSERYDVRLFKRVHEYFHRFYVPKDKSLCAVLEAVDVIHNEALQSQFDRENSYFESQYKGLNEFFPESHYNEAQRLYLNELMVSKNIHPANSNPITAWHGVDVKNLESICWYGLLNLTSNDPGYYGKGIYLTQHPGYGEMYAKELEKKPGSYSLLLCWVLLGRPFPLTKVQLGCELTQNYSSHYVIVNKKPLTITMCRGGRDFEPLKGVTNYFPVEGQEEQQGDEIVVFRTEQILPRYIVHYKIQEATKEKIGSLRNTSTSSNSPNVNSIRQV